MPFLLIKDLPRYECLLEAAKLFPDLDPSACEVFLHLMQAGDDAFRVVDSHLAEHHISQGRFMVLMLLLNKQTNCPHPRTPAELADLAHRDARDDDGPGGHLGARRFGAARTRSG